MYIISVIPISRSIGAHELTYFTSEKIALGQLVSVPLRKKDVPALVISTRDASKEKALLKRADFSLKKVSKVHAVSPLTTAFLSAAHSLADQYATTVGSVIEALTPTHILRKPLDKNSTQQESGGTFRQMLLEDIPEERIQHYRVLVRETFAKRHSVFVIVPTKYQVAEYAERLGKGIDSYVVSLHGGMSKKKVRTLWQKITEEEHPMLIVATPGFLGIPRTDIGVVVCEDEVSQHYFTIARPHVDMRIAARVLAEKLGAKYIAAGTLVQTETYHRYIVGELNVVRSPKTRIECAPLSIVDMTYNPDKPEKKPAVMSAELRESLVSLKKDERAFIFIARRGLSPLLRCRDCGTVKTCRECHSPLTLHNEHGRELVCHRCVEVYSVTDVCDVCNGWRIDQLGIGTGSIEEELLKLHLSVPLIRVDSDTTSTSKQVEKAIQYWYDEGGVLIGTEMALPFLGGGLSFSAVASMDALFALPHFRINERLFNILLTLQMSSIGEVLVQTRLPEHKLFHFAKTGDLKGFYEHELLVRTQLGYPPFKTLIQITHRGNERDIHRNMKALKEKLSKWNPSLYPGFHSKEGGKYVLHMLIKVDPQEWPQKELLARLCALSPAYEIKINPESIF